MLLMYGGIVKGCCELNEIKKLDNNRKGFAFLVEIIRLLLCDQGMRFFDKQVYPIVAKKFNVSVCVIERDVRYLLKKAGIKLPVKKFVKKILEEIKK